MRQKAALAVILILSSLGGVSFAQQKKEVPLSMEESIVQALKNNLNLAVEVLNPEISSSGVAKAKEIFIPQLALNFSKERAESPSTWWLQSSGVQISKTKNAEATLSQTLPTGGSLSVGMTNYNYNTNQLYQVYNPYYYNTLNFAFEQPLLKGLGPKIAGKEILIARQGQAQSEAQFRQIMMDVVYQVEENYWNLVFAVEDLAVKRQSLDLAKELLSKTRREVEVGQTAPIEVLNAEATVAQREAEIIQSEAAVKRSDELLRALLNINPDTPGGEIAVVPTDKPEMRSLKVTYLDVLEKAMVNRPEMDLVRSQIETRRIDFHVAKNALLPDLRLKMSYFSPGISGDMLQYENDDPYSGVIIGTIKGRSWDAVHDSLRFLYDNWTVGLSLTIPFADVFSKAGYTTARLDLEKTRAQLKVQEQTISLEVSDAVRSLDTDAKRVEAYKLARELAEKRLEAETKKLGVGLTTNYFVLEYQEKLASARSAEIKALVDYNISRARVEKVSGEILKKRNISIR